MGYLLGFVLDPDQGLFTNPKYLPEPSLRRDWERLSGDRLSRLQRTRRGPRSDWYLQAGGVSFGAFAEKSSSALRAVLAHSGRKTGLSGDEKQTEPLLRERLLTAL